MQIKNKLNWRGLPLALGLMLTLPNLSSAALFNEDCPCDVDLHLYDGGIVLAAELLWVTGHIADTGYAIESYVAEGVHRSKSTQVNFEHNVGYVINAGYQFPGTPYDIQAVLTSLVVEEGDKHRGPGLYANLANHLDIAVAPDLMLANPIDYAKGRARIDLRNIDFLFGQSLIMANNRLRMKWQIGLRSTTLHTQSKALYRQGGASGISEKITAENEFTGMGPLVGVQGLFYMGHGFSLTSQVTAGILSGKISASVFDGIINESILDENDKPSATLGKKVFDFEEKLVPVIDTRLGLLYTKKLRDDKELGIEVGVHVSQLIDVDFRFSSSGDDVGIAGLYFRATYLL